MEINQFLVDKDMQGLKCPKEMKPTYITIHNTNNNVSAEFNIKHMRQFYNPASYHYAVGADIWQGIEDTRTAYHCGDGAFGKGNNNSIGIEICYSTDYKTDKFDKAFNLAAKLVAFLMIKHDIPLENVVQHNYWSGEDCPKRIRAEVTWDKFINLVKKEVKNEQRKIQASSTSTQRARNSRKKVSS